MLSFETICSPQERREIVPEPTMNEAGILPTWRAAFLARCPRCGEGRLFARPVSLALAPQCGTCRLDFGFADPGDGPAVFAILILGCVLMIGVLVAEFRFGMPIWGHLMLWSVVTPILALGLLRLLKAGLVALQYRHQAEEQRFGQK